MRMLKITIICPGETKEAALKTLESKYEKLLSPYAQITWEHTKEFHKQKNQPVEIVREKESEELEKRIPQNSYIIVLDERGDEMRSEKFSKILTNCESKGETITFIIGGTFGLSEEIKKKANKLLALSKMTFTHEMTRSILLEQIYRGVCIEKGKNYHY